MTACLDQKPNMNNMEYAFGDRGERLKVDQVGMGRVFCTNVKTGEYVGDIGSPEEVEYYYDVVKEQGK